MKSMDIRQQFIDFFISKQHHVIRSSPLILSDDPTLLFTNAGMNQFKPIFLGIEKPKYSRVANSQRCMRVSGKHNDLEEVGISPHHHTLFEMLGNWSFGDYYKKEAIQWAWELLTEIWKLPPEKLWITVFQDEHNEIPADQEAFSFWRDLTSIPDDHILYFGRKDNFWEMGDTGPCGPCTEIHIDRGVDFCNLKNVPNHRCQVNGDCRRYMEIWNLVFIQYNRKNESELRPLTEKHVDTGMGLERITSILQKTKSNYDTDLFTPILDMIQSIGRHSSAERITFQTPYHVIADHSRAAAFLIADGVLPSNEWRGYVLRRIIRRAVRFGTKMNFSEPFLYKTAQTVIDMMASAFPELTEQKSRVCKIIRLEEERFFKTLRQGLSLVEDLIKDTLEQKLTCLPGDQVFKLYDTFGFPVDITEEIARESGLSLDEAGFQSAMLEQKSRARKAWKSAESKSVSNELEKIVQAIGPVVFTGYEKLHDQCKIKAILKNGSMVSESTQGDDIEIIIDPVPFYAESGGQMGDSGTLHSETAVLAVSNTKKLAPGIVSLCGKIVSGTFHLNDTVTAKVDSFKRMATARNHTATHLLHGALRRILGDHVKQAGSMVSSERLRFDFTHFSAVESKELEEIELAVNRAIMNNHRVQTSELPIDEALERGVIALFGEKYGETVRVVEVVDFSAELCGGTHVNQTGDIGLFKIFGETSIAAGVRRIEAVTGDHALELMTEHEQVLKSTANLLKSPIPQIENRIQALQSQLKQVQKDVIEISGKFAKYEIHEHVENPTIIDGVKVIATEATGLQINQLRDIADQLKHKLGSGIVILGVKAEDRVQIIVSITKDLTPAYHAGKIVQALAKIVGGGGGGRPDMAQAGGSVPEKLQDALAMVPEILRNQN